MFILILLPILPLRLLSVLIDINFKLVFALPVGTTLILTFALL